MDKFTRLKVVGVLLCSGFAGTVMADNAMTNGDANGMHDNQTNMTAVKPTDESLTKDIQTALSEYSKVDVSVKDGVVTLSGTVSNMDDKQKVEDLVKAVKGVTTVTNNVTVETVATTPTDTTTE